MPVLFCAHCGHAAGPVASVPPGLRRCLIRTRCRADRGGPLLDALPVLPQGNRSPGAGRGVRPPAGAGGYAAAAVEDPAFTFSKPGNALFIRLSGLGVDKISVAMDKISVAAAADRGAGLIGQTVRPFSALLIGEYFSR